MPGQPCATRGRGRGKEGVLMTTLLSCPPETCHEEVVTGPLQQQRAGSPALDRQPRSWRDGVGAAGPGPASLLHRRDPPRSGASSLSHVPTSHQTRSVP